MSASHNVNTVAGIPIGKTTIIEHPCGCREMHKPGEDGIYLKLCSKCVGQLASGRPLTYGSGRVIQIYSDK